MTFAIAFGSFTVGLFAGFLIAAFFAGARDEPSEADWDIGANDGR